METAFIGIGSNMGDRLGNISRAVDAVAHIPETHVEEVSHAYESEPAYVEEQPAFLNAVIEVSTELEPLALLHYLQDVESDMGRIREYDNGPRIIDLDLLLYGTDDIVSPELTVPHPGIAERDFVVTPLLEIAPRTHLPDGTRLQRSLATVGPVIRDLGAVPDAGAEHNMPIDATDWVVVAESELAQDVVAGFDSSLGFKREVLEQEGIPFAFEPYEPGVDQDPFGMQITFKIVVPADYAEKAGELLAEVAAAEPQFPDDLGDEALE